MTPTREEMLADVREVVARKDLTFGCKLKVRYQHSVGVLLGKMTYTDSYYCVFFKKDARLPHIHKDNIENILGHPVMLGDMVDFICSAFERPWCAEEGPSVLDEVLMGYKHKRKPLGDQPDDCIVFIHGLVKEWKELQSESKTSKT